MYKFEQYLNSDEKIIYQGRPEPGKGSRNVTGETLAIVFILMIQLIDVWSVITKTGDGANGVDFSFIMIFLIGLGLQCFFIYGIIYKLFLKSKAVGDDYYYLTNQRVFKYEAKKKKLVYGYLINYDDIRTYDIEGDYGDIFLGVNFDENDKKSSNNNKPTIYNPKNMPYIIFESVKFPDNIAKLAVDARNNLIK